MQHVERCIALSIVVPVPKTVVYQRISQWYLPIYHHLTENAV